ncbi:methyltransferase domain-containing protein [Nocardia yamanashiensis]|uniref:class I SAM-dependent methyltransferase n=1 Tax=Nocardia yamanashiensis TaxID=209247 RepID=UPI001E42CF1F|nr:class I SAM-dependent methyltransferase [Nocardia yamanashiensis]UGT43690.1 methyltransferase domain-containing protein [Nocardia yamanashiensis]
MPTIRPEEPPEPHRLRQVAESFGIDPDRYDRTRPHYPQALIHRIITESPGPEILDIGCGTGIAARQLQAGGCRVLGVEPDPRMAEYARRTGVTTEISTIENWDPAGRTFDAVISAQAWHWIDPLAGAAKAARALRPTGRIVLFWNAFQPPAPITEAFVTAFRRAVPDSPFDPGAATSALDAYQRMIDLAAKGIRETTRFTAPEQWRFDWTLDYTREAWLDMLPTQGALTRLSPAQQAPILEAVGAAIDARGGTFTMPYTALAITATI